MSKPRSPKLLWVLFALLCILIGCYPLSYVFFDNTRGFLSTKPPKLLSNVLWRAGFYTHIIFGGLALLTGWSQFSAMIRRTRPSTHRNLGRAYVFSVVLSGFAGIGIGFYATGGWISALGFICLGWVWLGTTAVAYTYALDRNWDLHKRMMRYSYAACFGAVTLRIWLPLLTLAFGEFEPAYQTVAWVSWVPNLMAVWMWEKYSAE